MDIAMLEISLNTELRLWLNNPTRGAVSTAKAEQPESDSKAVPCCR